MKKRNIYPTRSKPHNTVTVGACTAAVPAAMRARDARDTTEKHMKKIVVILTVCSVLLVYFYLHAQIQTAKGTIYVDNRERNYIVYVPVNYEKSGRKSLLIGLHGGYGQAGGMSHLTGLNDLSDLEGFLLVYPDGINRRWNDGTETIPNDVNDVAFISALIDRLIAEYRVDPKRVYVTGISNGGFLSV